MMHETRITREQIYRAVLKRERVFAIPAPALALCDTDPDAFMEASEEWHDRIHEAQLAFLFEMGEILNTLADEMGIDIAAIRGM